MTYELNEEESFFPVQTAAPGTIPVGRVIERLDACLAKNDYAAAERHLRYWLAEAEQQHDERGALTVLNEQIGLYRKLGRMTEGLAAIEKALPLAEALASGSRVALATTCINAATAYRAFDMAEKALPLYRRARTIYEEELKSEDPRLGGLYNNMALTVMTFGDFREAEELFEKALAVMAKQPHGEAEMAITCLNLADLVSSECGTEALGERIEAYLTRAEELLETEALPRDGYYAFVCEKCAPVFGFYGRADTQKKLTERAREIYERA